MPYQSNRGVVVDGGAVIAAEALPAIAHSSMQTYDYKASAVSWRCFVDVYS